MVDQRVIDYINKNLSRGISLQEIKQSLINVGWQQEEINNAINSINQGTKPTDFIAKGYKQNISNKKDNKKIILISMAVVIIFCLVLGFFLYPREVNLGDLQTGINPYDENNNQEISQEKPKENNEIDCGEDFDCFVNASENCNLAKLKHSLTLNLFGVEQTTSKTYKIMGIESNKCILFLSTDNIDLNFPEDAGISEESINEQKEMYDALEDREGTCKFETKDLTNMLKRWKQGNFSSGEVSCNLKSDGKTECTTKDGDFGAAECQGTYFIIDLCIDDGKCPPGCSAEDDNDC